MQGPPFTHNRTAYLTPGFFVQTAFYYGSSRNSFVFLLFLASILMPRPRCERSGRVDASVIPKRSNASSARTDSRRAIAKVIFDCAHSSMISRRICAAVKSISTMLLASKTINSSGARLCLMARRALS